MKSSGSASSHGVSASVKQTDGECDSFSPASSLAVGPSGKKGSGNFRITDIKKAAELVIQNPAIPVPEVVWEYDAGCAVQSHPFIGSDGTIIVGARGGAVSAFEPDTGVKKWTFQAGEGLCSSLISSPAGILYLPGGDDKNDKKLHALNEKTGKQIWEFDLKGVPSVSAGLGSDGTVFIGSSIFKPVSKIASSCHEGAVYALDGKTGEKKWEFKTDSLVVSAPVPGPHGSVYFGTYDNTFYSVDEITGEKKWEFKADGWISSSPTFSADGKVYFGSWDKKIYALDAKTGKTVWDYNTMGDVRGSICVGPDGSIYAGSFDGNVYAIDGGSGTMKWRRDTGGKVLSGPVMDDKGTLYVGNLDGKLTAYDSRTGARKWEFKAGDKIHGSPAVSADGIIYFGSEDNKLYALDSNKLSKIIDEIDSQKESTSNDETGKTIEIIDGFLVIDGVKLPLAKRSCQASGQSSPGSSE